MSFARSTWPLALGWATKTFDRDALVLIEVPKVMASKHTSEVGDNAVRETESVDDIFEELDCFLCSGQNKRFYSIHLENLSMVTYTYLKPPGAGLKGPIISSPQHAKGQKAGMVCISCTGTCICLAKNWHPSQRRMKSSASEMAVGQ